MHPDIGDVDCHIHDCVRLSPIRYHSQLLASEWWRSQFSHHRGSYFQGGKLLCYSHSLSSVMNLYYARNLNLFLFLVSRSRTFRSKDHMLAVYITGAVPVSILCHNLPCIKLSRWWNTLKDCSKSSDQRSCSIWLLMGLHRGMDTGIQVLFVIRVSVFCLCERIGHMQSVGLSTPLPNKRGAQTIPLIDTSFE